MPIAPTYPGVYIEEIPSGVRTITGAATSIAAFVDFFARGPMDKAVQVLSFADFEREFGGLEKRSEASYAIRQFFLNGGTQGWVVRVAGGAPTKAAVTLKEGITGGTPDSLAVTARSEGTWGNRLRVSIDYDTTDPNGFNLTVSEVATVEGRVAVIRQESFRGLSMSAGAPDYVASVLEAGSRLITATAVGPGPARPAASGTLSAPLGTPLGLVEVAIPRRVEVTFSGESGTPVSATVNLGTAAINSPEEAAARLEAAIRGANPTKPEWAQSTVRAIAASLQIAAGPPQPGTIVTFGPAPAASPLLGDSNTVTALRLGTATANVAQYQVGSTTPRAGQGAGTAGADGQPPEAPALIGNQAVDPPTGIYALDKVPLFNLLCLPRISKVGLSAPDFPEGQVDTVVSTATAYCERRWAFLILDTPSNITSPVGMRDWVRRKATLRHRNAALYFPRVQVTDPLDDFRLRSVGASGTIAGLYARTDAARGVWKAPAGTEAVLRGVEQLDYQMTDPENGTLNPEAINALRFFETYGRVCWGARTLDGSDQRASEWKYVSIRRLALFIEKSLFDGTQWVVFEPNDEPLWSQIRLNVGAFMHSLFRQGAFQGRMARDAYFVKCDAETTTQTDRNLGIVNIVVGFAPLKPAEFVIIKIQQIAGQIQT